MFCQRVRVFEYDSREDDLWTYSGWRLRNTLARGDTLHSENVEDCGMVVQTHGELAAFCERLGGARVICIDTEFTPEGRYYPELGTIQIAAGTEIALIDPLAVRDISCLLRLLVDPGVVKVFHAGEQDLEIFHRLLGRPVAPVFDTQIAAALLGYGDQISLRSLLQITLGEQLEKEQTFTDWLRRPLSSGQIEYALNDVRCLGRLHELLYKMLRAGGRLEWAEEEFRLLETAERFLPMDERQAYVLLKGAERLTQPALGLLQELAAWRELTARRLNVLPRRIAIDPVLMELAVRPRSSVRQLAQVRGLNSRQVEEYGAEIIEAVRRGARNAPPAIKRADPFPAALEATVDFLSLCMRAVAREQSISTGILASRSGLRLLVTMGETAHIPLLRGWRRQLVGNALLGALQGEVAASIVAATKLVHLQWQRSNVAASGSPHSPNH